MTMWTRSRLSTREYEELARRQADQDRSVTPKLGPRASKDSAQWERVRQQLIEGLKQWELKQWQ
jgi:hypothetical protein